MMDETGWQPVVLSAHKTDRLRRSAVSFILNRSYLQLNYSYRWLCKSLICARFAKALFILLFLFSANVYAQKTLVGVVVDTQGNRIANVEVSIISNSTTISRTNSDKEGEFVFANVPIDARKIFVKANGFAVFEEPLDKTTEQIRIILQPVPVNEEITITAARTETKISDTGASVVVLSQNEIATTAALTLDDSLRQVAGFSLFRRSGSRTSNPTTQGVSLRGTGASGASRALMMADNVSLNDPFGGWVYWNRIPRTQIQKVEVLRGGASSLYGSSALGGVINVLTKETGNDLTLSFESSAGNNKTFDGSLFAGKSLRNWRVNFAAESFQTNGYVPIENASRGTVDVNANSKNSSVNFTLERVFSKARIFFRPSYFTESRINGTLLARNRTHIKQAVIGADVSDFIFRLFLNKQVFDQTFTSVNSTRTTETLTRLQRVPAQSVGFSIKWSRAVHENHFLVAGFETKETCGASDEIGFTNNRATSITGAGGREKVFGFFFQDLFKVTKRLFLRSSFRVDSWRNVDAFSVTRTISTNALSLNKFSDSEEKAFSPNISASFQLNGNLSFNLSATHAFRAPTLNELYRSFRVGDVLTLANENLKAEKLTGFESGVNVNAFKQKLFVRSNVFWTDITRPISNVTLRTMPLPIMRQRQNLGRTRTGGFEVETESRIKGSITLSGGYLFSNAKVFRFPANTRLEGLQIPQTPRHQFTFQARYSKPTYTFALQGRTAGKQFEDDQNTLSLERFFTLDVFASHRFKKNLELFLAIENLFNSRYSIGRTPVLSVNQPFFIRIGFRFNVKK